MCGGYRLSGQQGGLRQGGQLCPALARGCLRSLAKPPDSFVTWSVWPTPQHWKEGLPACLQNPRTHPAGLASYHVQGHLHGLLQPKELPGHQVDPACPHSAGLMHPVLLGVPTRLSRRLLAALMLAALQGPRLHLIYHGSNEWCSTNSKITGITNRISDTSGFSLQWLLLLRSTGARACGLQ